MKFLSILALLGFMATGCSSSPKEKYEQRQAEAKEEYNEDLKQAQEDFQKDRKEKAIDMIKDSNGVEIDEKAGTIKITK